MPTVTVVDKRTFKHVPGEFSYYIGRPGVLGNPFTHKRSETLAKFICASRNEAVSKYNKHFKEQMRSNPYFKEEFNYLVGLAQQKPLNLICWCAPLQCHGDILKREILKRLQEA